MKHDIGIDEHNEFFRAKRIPKIVRAGKSAILRHYRKFHASLGITFSKFPRRNIARRVIDNHRFRQPISIDVNKRINAPTQKFRVLI